MLASGSCCRTRRQTSGPSSCGIIQSSTASVGCGVSRRMHAAAAVERNLRFARRHMVRPQLRHVAVAALAGVAGVALNVVPLPAVARLWPGRIVTLPIAMLYGPWYGLLAALLAALP